MTTHFEAAPLEGKTFGAVVTGLDLTAMDDATFDALYAAWLEHALLIFPGQHLSNEAQVEFAKRFGELEFDLAPITNVGKDGQVHSADDDDRVKSLRGNMGWHHDSTYMPVQAKGAVFTAHVVPSSGGETGWADMRAAYDALDAATRARIEDLLAYHSLWYSQAKLGHQPKVGAGYGFHDMDPPLRPLVKVHPETGRRSLNVGRHAYGIPGLDPDESEQLIETLMAQACQGARIYHHHWSPGDAVIWDNRCLMHQGRPWDMTEKRVMWHARIKGGESEFATHA